MIKLVLPSFARFDTAMQNVFVETLIGKHFEKHDYKLNRVAGDEVYDYVFDITHGVLLRLFSTWIDDVIRCANLGVMYEANRHQELEVDGNDIPESTRFESNDPTLMANKDEIEALGWDMAFQISEHLEGEDFAKLHDVFREAHMELVRYKDTVPGCVGFWHDQYHEEVQLFEGLVRIAVIQSEDFYKIHEGVWDPKASDSFESRSIDERHEFYLWGSMVVTFENANIIPPGNHVSLNRLTDEAVSALEGY